MALLYVRGVLVVLNKIDSLHRVNRVAVRSRSQADDPSKCAREMGLIGKAICHRDIDWSVSTRERFLRRSDFEHEEICVWSDPEAAPKPAHDHVFVRAR